MRFFGLFLLFPLSALASLESLPLPFSQALIAFRDHRVSSSQVLQADLAALKALKKEDLVSLAPGQIHLFTAEMNGFASRVSNQWIQSFHGPHGPEMKFRDRPLPALALRLAGKEGIPSLQKRVLSLSVQIRKNLLAKARGQLKAPDPETRRKALLVLDELCFEQGYRYDKNPFDLLKPLLEEEADAGVLEQTYQIIAHSKTYISGYTVDSYPRKERNELKFAVEGLPELLLALKRHPSPAATEARRQVLREYIHYHSTKTVLNNPHKVLVRPLGPDERPAAVFPPVGPVFLDLIMNHIDIVSAEDYARVSPLFQSAFLSLGQDFKNCIDILNSVLGPKAPSEADFEIR